MEAGARNRTGSQFVARPSVPVSVNAEEDLVGRTSHLTSPRLKQTYCECHLVQTSKSVLREHPQSHSSRAVQ
jgi:hypothetical protein